MILAKSVEIYGKYRRERRTTWFFFDLDTYKDLEWQLCPKYHRSIHRIIEQTVSVMVWRAKLSYNCRYEQFFLNNLVDITLFADRKADVFLFLNLFFNYLKMKRNLRPADKRSKPQCDSCSTKRIKIDVSWILVCFRVLMLRLLSFTSTTEKWIKN